VCSSLDGLRNLLSGDIACFVGTKVAKLNDGMGFEFEHLFSVEDAFFARKDHPLAHGTRSQSELTQYPRLDVAPFVNRHLGIMKRTDFDTILVPKNVSQTSLLSTNSMTAGIDILQDTDAILTYPILCQPYFQKHDVTMIDVVDRPRQKIEIGIYRLAEKKPDRQLAGILEQVRRSMAALQTRSD
jgi:DNA-binding transcriptional LysR family regulator